MWRRWSKRDNSEAKARETALNELVSLGYARNQAEQSLDECDNDIAKAKSKLEKMSEASSSTANNPPPYSNEPPPSYSEALSASGSSENQCLYVSHEKESFLQGLDLKYPIDNDERCSSCFDQIKPDPDEGFSGKMVWQGSKVSKF